MTQPPTTVPGEARLARPDAPRLTAEVFDHREQRAAFGYDGVDGLPRQVSETSTDQSLVLPLHPDTFICMADYTAFFLRDESAGLNEEFAPDQVQRIGNEFWISYDAAVERVGAERAHLVRVHMRTGKVLVEPKRRPCRHYVRQLVDYEGRRKSFVSRMCTALRDESGEYQSLRDTGVYACELRDPPEDAGTRELDEFDARKISEGLLRDEIEHVFDVDAALAQQPLEGLLIGHWMAPDAIPERDLLLRSDTALLLQGNQALSLIRGERGNRGDREWQVMGAPDVPTLIYSRHWPEIVANDSFVFVTYDTSEPQLHLRRPVIYRVTKAQTDYPRAQAMAEFGAQLASRIRHDRVVLLTIEKQEQP